MWGIMTGAAAIGCGVLALKQYQHKKSMNVVNPVSGTMFYSPATKYNKVVQERV